MARRKNRAKEQKLQKALSLAIISVIAAILAVVLYYTAGAKPASPPATFASDTKIHFIDVGQGDCVLIEQGGEFALIDAGLKQSDDVILDYLKAQNVQSLKYIIMSHPHADHIGAMGAVVKKYEVQNMVLPQFEKYNYPTTATFINLIKAVSDKKVPIQTATVGMELPLGSGVIKIVGDGVAANDFNNISISTLFTGAGITYLATGDAEKEAEAALAASGQTLAADIFKAGHHGSDTSNTKALLNKVLPKAVIISCGKDNDYGHPHQSSLDTFNAIGADIYRTDQSGTVVAFVDEKGNMQIQKSK
ncbi:MAG: ComEC/Rec2 family competence protein [Oscillospiraceae bacterium]